MFIKMKKTILLVVAVLGFAFAAKAQNNAIGARISGGNQWYCAEISYQRSLDAPNRIETDLGYRVDDEFDIGYLFLTGVYQLHFDISSAKNLGWYFGFGPRLEILYYDGHPGYDNPINFAGALGVVGQVSMDYHFDADDDEYVRLLAQVGCRLFDVGQETIVNLRGQVNPTEEVVACAGFIKNSFISR